MTYKIVPSETGRACGILATNRQVLMDWNCSWPVVVTMPCGANAIFNKAEDWPAEDLPCSCGNPNHWFIKYEDE